MMGRQRDAYFRHGATLGIFLSASNAGAVPKNEMLRVARLLEDKGYKNLYNSTELSL